MTTLSQTASLSSCHYPLSITSEMRFNAYFYAGQHGKPLPLTKDVLPRHIENYLSGLDLYVNDLSIKQDSGNHVPQAIFEQAAKHRDFAEKLLGIRYN